MINPHHISVGKLVRHSVEGYIGTFDGTTGIRSLFEKSWDKIGCRIHVKTEARRRIASPDNLELLDKELTLEEKHKMILQGLGLEWKGVRSPSKDREVSRQRVAHCYLCKHPLDNTVDKECVACGWILCRCGACGCGYGK